jgi:hypothetical protein
MNVSNGAQQVPITSTLENVAISGMSAEIRTAFDLALYVVGLVVDPSNVPLGTDTAMGYIAQHTDFVAEGADIYSMPLRTAWHVIATTPVLRPADYVTRAYRVLLRVHVNITAAGITPRTILYRWSNPFRIAAAVNELVSRSATPTPEVKAPAGALLQVPFTIDLSTVPVGSRLAISVSVVQALVNGSTGFLLRDALSNLVNQSLDKVIIIAAINSVTGDRTQLQWDSHVNTLTRGSQPRRLLRSLVSLACGSPNLNNTLMYPVAPVQASVQVVLGVYVPPPSCLQDNAAAAMTLEDESISISRSIQAAASSLLLAAAVDIQGSAFVPVITALSENCGTSADSASYQLQSQNMQVSTVSMIGPKASTVPTNNGGAQASSGGAVGAALGSIFAIVALCVVGGVWRYHKRKRSLITKAPKHQAVEIEPENPLHAFTKEPSKKTNARFFPSTRA